MTRGGTTVGKLYEDQEEVLWKLRDVLWKLRRRYFGSLGGNILEAQEVVLCKRRRKYA